MNDRKTGTGDLTGATTPVHAAGIDSPVPAPGAVFIEGGSSVTPSTPATEDVTTTARPGHSRTSRPRGELGTIGFLFVAQEFPGAQFGLTLGCTAIPRDGVAVITGLRGGDPAIAAEKPVAAQDGVLPSH